MNPTILQCDTHTDDAKGQKTAADALTSLENPRAQSFKSDAHARSSRAAVVLTSFSLSNSFTPSHNYIHRMTGTETEKCSIAQLRESIARRVNLDDEHGYWQQSVGPNHAKEAIKVYHALLEDESHLERILVARKFDETLCTDLFYEQVRFRARYRPQAIDPKSISVALPSGAWRLAGYTRDGHIISNYKLSMWDPHAYTADNDDGVEEYVRYVLYMIELMIGSMKPNEQQFVVLFDLSGFSVRWVFQNNARMMIRKLIYVSQAQYPERLHKALLVNAPYGFETAWSMIKPLLDEKTAGKIHFCTSKDLTKDIAPEVLCVDYGGTREEYPIPAKTLKEELEAFAWDEPEVFKDASETEDESEIEV